MSLTTYRKVRLSSNFLEGPREAEWTAGFPAMAFLGAASLTSACSQMPTIWTLGQVPLGHV